MPAPVVPSQFEAAVPANNAELCVRFTKWLGVPALLSQLFQWMFTSSGAISAEFKAEIASALLPPGTLSYSASISMGDQWLLCNGQAVSRTDYADLFAAIGTTYGSGDGSTTFNVPDGSRRSLIGTGGSWSIATKYVGEETHTQTESEMPSHTHGWSGPESRTQEKGSGANVVWNGTAAAVTDATGGGQPFNVVHSSVVAYMFIHV